jgi:outer membrane protein with beta-barrel domain
MAPRLVVAASLGPLLFAPAAQAECRDGWFCEETPPVTAPGAPAEPPARAEPPAEVPANRELALLVPGTPKPPDEEPPPPPEPDPDSRSELGINVHFGIGLFGPGASDNAVLGGAGLALRYRPLPWFALDLGLELLGGTDYNGNSRGEQAFVTNGMLFMNPGDPVQAYVLAGFNLGGAQARMTTLGGHPVPEHDVSYTYLGAQGGLGVEWRFAASTALAGDFQLFARTRLDGEPYGEPEYEDASTHLVTNGSGGGLFRVGATFYF